MTFIILLIVLVTRRVWVTTLGHDSTRGLLIADRETAATNLQIYRSIDQILDYVGTEGYDDDDCEHSTACDQCRHCGIANIQYHCILSDDI